MTSQSSTMVAPGVDDSPEIFGQTLYRYVNHTPQFQIIRIANIPHCFFERAVMPGQELCFTAVPEAELEVHAPTPATATLAARIRCDRLPAL